VKEAWWTKLPDLQSGEQKAQNGKSTQSVFNYQTAINTAAAMDRYKHAEVYKISFYQDLKNNPVIL
jgi:hypothetical protein